jgi:transcriptional regulator with XRE-family HTH domain
MLTTGSSIPRRQLGRYLKLAREEAGVALEAAARELEWSRARMYRIEGGIASLRSHDVLAMCRLYGASTDMTDALVNLAKKAKSEGWWHAYGDAVPSWFELYVGLEAAASRLRHYAPGLVPGLLQTREYAEAVYQTKPGITADEIEQAVAMRLERQRELLGRRNPPPPRFDVIVDESVLRRRVFGMRGQLAHLARIAQEPRIGLRVLPTDTGPHHATLAGSFVILDFPPKGTRPSEPTTVYSESLTGALYLDKARDVATYAEAWSALEDLALDEEQSRELVVAIKEGSLDA